MVGTPKSNMGNALWKNLSHSFGWFYINKHNKVRLPRGFCHPPPPFTLHSKVTHCLCKCRREGGCQNHALFLEGWLGPRDRWKILEQKWIKRGLEQQLFVYPAKLATTRIWSSTAGFQITFFRFSLDIYPCSYRHNMENYDTESDFLSATITTVCFFVFFWLIYSL